MTTDLTFIDLFAGIGGIRLGFERAGCRCVFSSESDRFARETYEANFGEVPSGDIREIGAGDIPDFDILCAGFPCQPFSLAGVSKRNSLNLPHGFEDETKGTLFHEILRILREKQPAAYFLENVSHLARHDGGKTFAVIRRSLGLAGYSVYYQVIDASAVVPQRRRRIYIVGFRDRLLRYTFPSLPAEFPSISSILEPEVPDSYTLSDHLWQYLRDYAAKHRARGNGFGYGLVALDGASRTLSARYHKDGSEILIPQEGRNPRMLTPRECARLQGFPEQFEIPVSDTQAYRQFGNSVAVPVIEYLAAEMVRTLQERPRRRHPYQPQQAFDLDPDHQHQ